MDVHLLGGNGFIGRAIKQHSPSFLPNKLICWSHRPSSGDHFFDLFSPDSWAGLCNARPKVVLFLSWPGLPDYNGTFHLTRNMPVAFELFETLVASGCQKIVVSGTCYEYGLHNGCLREDSPVAPCNLYGIAKNTLREGLEILCKDASVKMVWARIFYPYGSHQNPSSLYPSLIKAIAANQATFQIGSGRQIRDFVEVSVVAKQLMQVSLDPLAEGVFNCGSGVPMSVLEFVETAIRERGSPMIVERSKLPDRQDEPLAFWADMTNLHSRYPQLRD